MILISLLFAIVATLIAVVFINSFSSASTKYKSDMEDTAKNDFAAMFLFIEPEKLLAMNLIVVVLGALFVWLYSGLWVLAVISAVILLYLPRMFLHYFKKKRKTEIIKHLPDVLLSVSRSMQAGTSLNQALEVAVEEDKGPLIQEFSLFLRELRMGVDFNDALRGMADRIDAEEFSLVTSGMMISREIGGNLAETLDRLAEMIRRKIEMEGKIVALTSQGRLQGIVMTLLPIFVGLALYQMEPFLMGRIFYEPIGWMVIAFVFVMEVIGYFFIRKIVNIDV